MLWQSALSCVLYVVEGKTESIGALHKWLTLFNVDASYFAIPKGEDSRKYLTFSSIERFNMLDEQKRAFLNVKGIPSWEIMVDTCRKVKGWFHLVV